MNKSRVSRVSLKDESIKIISKRPDEWTTYQNGIEINYSLEYILNNRDEFNISWVEMTNQEIYFLNKKS